MTAPAAPALRCLTAQQRQVLFWLAHGDTHAVIAKRLGITVNGLSTGTVRHFLRKLGASSVNQAVYIATRQGLIGDWPDCGIDRSAYLRHLRRKEAPCPACKRVNAEHGVAQRAGGLTGVQGFQPKEPAA